MKQNYALAFALTSLFFAVFCTSCSKNDGGTPSPNNPELPTVSTTAATNITATTAESGGNVSSEGSSPVTARGVCWNQVAVPSTAGPHTVDGSGTGTYTSSVTGLNPNTAYSVKAYATNSVGTAYGNSVLVITPQQLSIPTVTTIVPYNIKSYSVYTGGEVTASGNATVTAKGVCWSTSPNPTIANNVLPYGSGGLGSFTSYVNTLTVHTTYYLRAYATNNVGTGYGEEYTLRTIYTIGEGLGGGKIFYLNQTNDHGLIAAIYDQSGGSKWNFTSNPYSNINAYSLNNGMANTNAIIAVIGNAGHAAAVCRAYTGGGYNDWYLPSIDELNLLSQQKYIIGNFQSYYYWSSTASSNYVANAWSVDFGGGSTIEWDKTYIFYVRAIRAF
ncbi:MAG TPA: DUF1566 domain-containing protein [Chitinophagaceae bacterium]|nr:DUF1566 domain-containing protein [Chitinophagaceae bacterium]